MNGRGINEVKNSLLELTKIYKPSNPRKFVNDFIKRYRITHGYEDELIKLVTETVSEMK